MGKPGERDYRYHHRTQPRARERTIMANDAMGDMEAMRRENVMLRAELAMLRAELAAAREDTARLDWIFEVGWAEQRYGDTLLRNRAQIDAARRREEEKR